MNPIKELYLTTAELLKVLNNQELEREDKIAQVDQLLEKREQLFQKLPSSPTAGEKQVGQEIIKMNDKVLELLEGEKQNIQQDLRTVKLRKKTEKNYVNPYESVQVDGVFYDKKK